MLKRFFGKVKSKYETVKESLEIGAFAVLATPLLIIKMPGGSGAAAAIGQAAGNFLICAVFSPVTLPLALPIILVRLILFGFDSIGRGLCKLFCKEESLEIA